MDVFQLCQNVSTIESTIEFLFGTDMLSASFNCHLCGTECTLVEEEEDEEAETPKSPRSPNARGYSTPSKKKSTPKSKSSPKKSPRSSPKSGGGEIKSPTRRQFSVEEEEASVRSIAYASVLGGPAAAASIAAAQSAQNELVSSRAGKKGTPSSGSQLELSISTSNEHDSPVNSSEEEGTEDDDEEEDEDEDSEDGSEDSEEDQAMKVSETDRFWWCCPRCDEAFSIRTDSMFEASKLPLQRLVVMVYCFSVKVPRQVAASLAGVTPEDLDTWYEACHGVIDLLDSEENEVLTDELRALQVSQREAERVHVQHMEHVSGEDLHQSPDKKRGEAGSFGYRDAGSSGDGGAGGYGNGGSGNGIGVGGSGGGGPILPTMCAACGANVITGVVPEAPDEWKKKANGMGELELAEQETDVAEGEYDRLLYEEGQISSELRDLKDYKLESALRKIKRVVTSSQDFDQLEKLVQPINNLPLLTQYNHDDSGEDSGSQSQQGNGDEEPGSQLAVSPEQIGNQRSNPVSKSLKLLISNVSVPSKERNLSLVSEAIDQVEANIQARISKLEKKLLEVDKDKDKALANVETWRARQLEAPNYDEVMKRREREWLEAEKGENEKCLIEMRKYLPQNVAKLSKSDLQQKALDAAEKFKSSNKAKKGEDRSLLGLYPSDLAIYLKECSFLHWLVMHPTDIRKSNFLLGDSSQHFQNLEKYDIVELRAVAAVLPDSFEFDQDGRKADWRASFLTRLKTLTQQQERAKVRCGWDPLTGSRRELTLPDLAPEHRRRSIYFYTSDKDAHTRLSKMDTQAMKLKEKKERLEKLKEEKIPELKAEYEAVLGDGRGEYFKQMLGKAQLAAVRDEAKRELDGANKELKQLEMDVVAGTRAAAAAPVDREELIEEFRKVRELPNGCWRRIGEVATSATLAKKKDVNSPACVKIEGPFDPHYVVAAPAARSLTRKLSVEEEAQLRVEEMNKVMGTGGGDDVVGGAGKMQRRSSVRDRMLEMEKSKQSGSTNEASSNEPTERIVTAPPVPARSMRVARLIEKAHQEKMLAEQKQREAAASSGVGSLEGGAPHDEEPMHHAHEWNCALCSKRNSNTKHLCGTCGRPRGMISAKPRRDLTISHHAMHAAIQARNKGGGGGGHAISAAFGRTNKTPGSETDEKAKGAQLPSKPEKNHNMMAELQAKLKRRASN